MKDSEKFEAFLRAYCSMKTSSNLKLILKTPGRTIIFCTLIGISFSAFLRIVFFDYNDSFMYALSLGSLMLLIYFIYSVSYVSLSDIEFRQKKTSARQNVEDDFFELLATSHSVPDKFKKVLARELVSSNCVTWEFVLELLKEAKRSDALIEESTKPGAEKLKEYADK